MKPVKTWVLIADGARARILQNEGPGRGLQAVDGLEFDSDHAATHEIVDDRQGRTHASVGYGRSAIEAHSDPHRELKARFATRLADELDQGLAARSYDRLIIVAAPVTLGDLRKAISDHVRKKVVGEVALDLTKTPNGDVAHHLKDVLNA